MSYVIDFSENLWTLTLEAAPWLAFGLLVAGMIRMWMPQRVLQRWLGGKGMGAVTRAAIVGTPIPLCSCSVLPAALALRRGGASRSATTSFLIATPENGVDSIALSYALLGPFMAVVRPVAAFFCALLAGALTEISELTGRRRSVAESNANAGGAEPPSPTTDTQACCSQTAGRADSAQPTTGDADGGTNQALALAPQGGCCQSEPKADEPVHGCCGSEDPANAPASEDDAQPNWLSRSVQTLRYGFIDFYADILGWLVVGMLLAAAMTTIFPPDSISDWDSGILAMLGMLVIGVPMYICATASTPVAASLLLAGVSPGTVLVFLLAGPATNLASLGIVRRELGTPAVVAYLTAIGIGSIGAGLLTDLLAGVLSINVLAQTEQPGQIMPYWLALGSALLLIGLGLWFALRWVIHKAQGKATCCDHEHERADVDSPGQGQGHRPAPAA